MAVRRAKRVAEKSRRRWEPMKIKKGDLVCIISGAIRRHAAKSKDDAKKDSDTSARRRVGKVLFVNREKNTLIVEGFNVVRRHTKPTRQNPQGGIIEKEAPIQRSRVMLWSEELGAPTRIGYKFIAGPDGRKVKVRISRKNGSEI